MGPAATGQFLVELARVTPASVDQDHYRVIVDSDPSVPDRTTSILAGDNAPAAPIRAGLERLASWGADLLAVPCNTAHVFIDQFREELPVPLVHIVEATLDEAMLASPEGAWLTASTGTVRTGLYQRAAEARGYPLFVPDPSEQDDVMDVVWFVKSGELGKAGLAYAQAMAPLFGRHDVPVLTACTELPLAFETSGLARDREVSSLTALARATVAAAQDWVDTAE